MTDPRESSGETGALHGVSGLIRLRLSGMVLALMLLGLGKGYERFFADSQAIANIMTAIAALLVTIPLGAYAVRGFLRGGGEHVSEQLVFIAVLASMAQRDFTTATLIPFFMVLAHFLEERSIMGVQEAISGLRELYSVQARKIVTLDSGQEQELQVNPQELQAGDHIICYPGERITADGLILQGESTLDQSPITGESRPVKVAPGSRVFAGTLNFNGRLRIQVTCSAQESSLGRVMEMLREAEGSQTPIQKLVDKYVEMYLPLILTIAAISLFFTYDINRAVTVLVISCPCALVLASPTAMIAALLRASRRGIMIKNTAFLEIMPRVRTIVFDKTGTLTYGRMRVSAVEPLEGVTDQELLHAAGLCASASIHPVSRALVEHCQERKIELGDLVSDASAQSREVFGKGVLHQTAQGCEYRLGKRSWVCSEHEEPENTAEMNGESGESGDDQGTSLAWVGRDGVLMGRLVLCDELRDDTSRTMEELRELGIEKIILLTGDRETIGARVALTIGADEAVCDCLPGDKLRIVRELQESLGPDSPVMTVGDGINDAPALAASSIGVAMGALGNHVAIQSADIALNSPGLGGLPEMFRLSRQTLGIINQNILIGAGFSLLMLTLAVGGIIDPVFGAFFHNIGSIFVVLNSSRIVKVSAN